MYNLIRKFSLRTCLILLALFTLLPRETEAQKFLRLDSLRFGDSSCYYQTTPYGPVYLDITDSAANARIDTVKGYYVTAFGDTVIGTWYNARTNTYDTMLIAGNGKTNTWKLHSTENPWGIKLVRTNDSSTVTMQKTKIVLYGVKQLYNNILKKRDQNFTSVRNDNYFWKSRVDKDMPLMAYTSRMLKPDRIIIPKVKYTLRH